jgi:hypothetical protein
VTDEVDALVDLVQPTGREAPIDLASGDPARQKLPPGNDPALPPRERRDHGVRSAGE